MNQALRNIPADISLHDIAAAKEQHRIRPRKLEPVDGNRPLSKLIDTAGVKALHPDGDYWPTLRQQMRLQTFLDCHVLEGINQGDFTRQIGDAVPCKFMKKIFREIIKSLEDSDKEIEACGQEVPVETPPKLRKKAPMKKTRRGTAEVVEVIDLTK